jgi:hypothetical protein
VRLRQPGQDADLLRERKCRTSTRCPRFLAAQFRQEGKGSVTGRAQRAEGETLTGSLPPCILSYKTKAAVSSFFCLSMLRFVIAFALPDEPLI